MSWYTQSDYEIRLEWGLEGSTHLANEADVAIVVDVLSFSTCVDVGVSAGAKVFPYLFKDERAQEFAKSIDAICANPKRSKDQICLSPSTLLQLNSGQKIVLPSPNGATISFSLKNCTVLAGSLRNATAVASAALQLGKSILVIAAGERWNDGSLRPSLEDLIGAGAIISKLQGRNSPEAIAALHVFNQFRNDLFTPIKDSSSGRELIERGFPEDIEMATQYDVSKTVPILKDRSFMKWE